MPWLACISTRFSWAKSYNFFIAENQKFTQLFNICSLSLLYSVDQPISTNVKIKKKKRYLAQENLVDIQGSIFMDVIHTLVKINQLKNDSYC